MLLAVVPLVELSLIIGVEPCALAGAPADRVVVVVDSGAGPGLDSGAVRRAISDELGAPVIAPSDPAAGDASTLLVVSADKATIRMTLRAGDRGTTTRTIPASPDRAVRLREIAWLAGNLLRDQVSSIVGSSAPAAGSRSTPPAAPAPAVAPVDQPRQERAATPVPGAAKTAAVAPPVNAIASASTSPAARRPEWVIAALAGVAVAPNYDSWFSSSYQLDFRRRSPSGLVLGLGLQAGYAWTGGTVHIFGVDGVIGKEWRGSRWFGELTIGIGLEAARPLSDTSSSTCENCVLPPKHVSGDPTLAAFVPLACSFGVALTPSIDFAVRLNLQPSSNGIINTTGGATAGVRWRVP